MTIAVIILAVVLGGLIGFCIVLWGRMQELSQERDWPVVEAPVVAPPPEVFVEPKHESVAVIEAMGDAFAKLWNPSTQPTYQAPDGREEVIEDEPDYDPWAEHEKEMLAGFTMDLTAAAEAPVGEPPDEVE